MKKLLNPKLNARQEAVVIDSSSSEEAKIDKRGSKSKRKSMVKSSSSSQSEKTKISQSVRKFEQPRSELSEIVLEIKNKILKQQQDEEAKMCPIESQEWEEEDEQMLREAGILEDPGVSADYTDLLMKEEIIPEIPSSDKENTQQYKKHMKHLQQVNDGLLKVNKGLIGELLDVKSHFQELVEVSKEVLKRKRMTDKHCSELESTIKNLQQENRKLTQKMIKLEQQKKKTKRKVQSLDGIALLAEAAKEL